MSSKTTSKASDMSTFPAIYVTKIYKKGTLGESSMLMPKLYSELNQTFAYRFGHQSCLPSYRKHFGFAVGSFVGSLSLDSLVFDCISKWNEIKTRHAGTMIYKIINAGTKRRRRSAKPLFIGSIPIAASILSTLSGTLKTSKKPLLREV
jgi:hypothetical protein